MTPNQCLDLKAKCLLNDLRIIENCQVLHLTFLSLSTSLVAQMVKRLSTMRETWVRSLRREDSLEKEMATHSSTLA